MAQRLWLPNTMSSMANQKTVLVTGAAGFIGSAITRKLSSDGVNVIALDALLDGLYPAKEKQQRFDEISTLPGVSAHQLDLRYDDLNVLPNTITHVINEAAMPGLGLSWQDFDLYSSCNLGGLSRLIEATTKWPLERFVQISTSSVYGASAVGDENQPLEPVSPYGVTKLAAENLVFAHKRDSGFPAVILRYFSVYGPGQRPDMAYRKFIQKALDGDPITLFGTGEQSRSNTYIDDCVAGTIAALTKGVVGEIYNLAGGSERSINEALRIIEEDVGHTLTVNKEPAARGDQARTMGDSQKAQSVLGFTNTVTLEEGLARQIEWQRSL
jgi:UDP-glucuronate 4-epimerase